MQDRDSKILRFLALYRAAPRAVIEAQHFGGGNGDHVIQRLLEEGRIKSYSGLPGGLCYYQLSITEAKQLHVPVHRGLPHSGAALREALAVLWFCCMAGKRRRRLERKEIGKLFGRGRGFGKPHCAEQGEGGGVIYRVYAPGPNSRNDYRIRTLREECRIVLEHPQLAKWVLAGAFRFAVLVETPGRLESIKKLLEKNGPWPLKIHLELVPGTNELATKIRKLREEQTTHAGPERHPAA